MFSMRCARTIAVATIRFCNRFLDSEARADIRLADNAYILGYETGYDKGWTDARKHELPVAVTFLQRSAKESADRLGVEL